MNEVFRYLWIMDKRELYESFIHEKWAKTASDLVRGTAMDLPFHNLLFTWREANYAHQLPWTMIEQMKAFAQSNAMEQNPYSIRLVDAIKNSLVIRMGDDLNPTRRKRLQGIIDGFDAEIKARLKTDEIQFPALEYWQELCNKEAFQLSISGTQGMAFCSLYFAYENFLPTTYWAVTGDVATTTKDSRRFATKFGECFGTDIFDYCIKDEPIEIARLTRNDYAHNGCKAGEKLLALPHDLKVDPKSGLFCITAVNTIALYRTLQPRVGKLIQVAMSKLSGKVGTL
jgi:hypothetical protein